jgi:DNA (cytosine-5)-methyltransferase 1
MNSLSLFSGAGGGLLAEKYLLNWRSIGYVEYNIYCQKVIAQRIKDGFLDEAPIFGDIDHFIKSGAAKKYAGYIDVLTAGFPCQPFSVAGKKKGQDDERNKWPQTLQCIRDVRPRYAFLENVPGLLNSGYFGEILSSLAEAGFNARWCVLGADDVGAPHRRKRLWILAHPNSLNQRAWEEPRQSEGNPSGECPSDSSEDVAHSVSDSEGSAHGSKAWGGFERWENEDIKEWYEVGGNPTNFSGQWAIEPNVGRVAHGVASRVDRLKAIGNGQVPRVAATAWKLLSG